MRTLAAVVALAAALVAAVTTAGAAPSVEATRLFASVDPNARIILTDASGNRVTQLDPGTYEIVVRDTTDEHNFHLTGPGVNRTTSVSGLESVTWTVTFTNGTYNYVCDPHASAMRGSFVVGTVSNPPPAPAPVRKLNGTVGPGFTIALRTPAGVRVRTLRTGRYDITVRDRSRMHNFHAIGAGINRRTTVPFVGTTTWKVRLAKGTLRILCDPHARTMRASIKVG